MELENKQKGVYDSAKLSRLSKSDDFAELERIIKDSQEELIDTRNVDAQNRESDVIGRNYAYEAMQGVLDIVHGTEQVEAPQGDNNYT